jgi:hypothetical protein
MDEFDLDPTVESTVGSGYFGQLPEADKVKGPFSRTVSFPPFVA